LGVGVVAGLGKYIYEVSTRSRETAEIPTDASGGEWSLGDVWASVVSPVGNVENTSSGNNQVNANVEFPGNNFEVEEGGHSSTTSSSEEEQPIGSVVILLIVLGLLGGFVGYKAVRKIIMSPHKM
jgi:hypothetical protein